ncbi:hypothetical protein [Pseudoalteromonas luteoviolacea]|uniref:Uncharacterized protein n=1 Tax=Pseudoalteromonas luteoviolacea DSM 6061 TaxID=1365250 RepID=A0A166VSP2_9GAMM|nr:hypothetical protein [Pseudoalteromonas luteoviolacea]KZN33658.1 hypothetical protein N475_19995 [Pseudoalteromonas luteoviolacea DSM 6061]MBE0389570.1 hypothetical protein [Pseudoalteromonas luteoviolacea DSM 6061]
MSANQEISRCIHPLTKISKSQLLRINENDTEKLKQLLPKEDFLWQLALDPCSHESAFLHSLQIAPNISFVDRRDISQPANLCLKLFMQDPHWEFAEIIFNPDATTLVHTHSPSLELPPEEKHVTASVDLSNKSLAIINIQVPAHHPITDFSSSSPLFEFFVRGKHLESGKLFCTAQPNILAHS